MEREQSPSEWPMSRAWYNAHPCPRDIPTLADGFGMTPKELSEAKGSVSVKIEANRLIPDTSLMMGLSAGPFKRRVAREFLQRFPQFAQGPVSWQETVIPSFVGGIRSNHKRQMKRRVLEGSERQRAGALRSDDATQNRSALPRPVTLSPEPQRESPEPRQSVIKTLPGIQREDMLIQLWQGTQRVKLLIDVADLLQQDGRISMEQFNTKVIRMGFATASNISSVIYMARLPDGREEWFSGKVGLGLILDDCAKQGHNKLPVQVQQPQPNPTPVTDHSRSSTLHYTASPMPRGGAHYTPAHHQFVTPNRRPKSPRSNAGAQAASGQANAARRRRLSSSEPVELPLMQLSRKRARRADDGDV